MTSPLSKIEESVSNLSMFKDFVQRMQEGADRINSSRSSKTTRPSQVIEDMESLNTSLKSTQRDVRVVPMETKETLMLKGKMSFLESAQQTFQLELAKLNETKARFEHVLNEFREEKRRYGRMYEKQSEKISILKSQIRLGAEESKKYILDVHKKFESRVVNLEGRVGTQEEDFEKKYNELLLKMENRNDEFEEIMRKNFETLATRVKAESKLLREETERRRKMETMIMSMVEDLCTKMSQGLRREQKSRVDMEEKLMRVLKRVCSEVETHLDH